MLVPRQNQFSVLFLVFIWNVLKWEHFLIFLNIFRKAFFLKYPPLKPNTKLKIGFVWVLTSLMMPGMIEHYTSAHRELQCFQMRENSVFWTCPTPNQTEMKNPWKSLTFTPKYIICPERKIFFKFCSLPYISPKKLIWWVLVYSSSVRFDIRRERWPWDWSSMCSKYGL